MSKYWNPYLETLEPQKTKHLQLLRFKEAFEFACAYRILEVAREELKMDLDSGKIITEPDQYGKLIITAFHRKGRPVIRFDTCDLASSGQGDSFEQIKPRA